LRGGVKRTRLQPDDEDIAKATFNLKLQDGIAQFEKKDRRIPYTTYDEDNRYFKGMDPGLDIGRITEYLEKETCPAPGFYTSNYAVAKWYSINYFAAENPGEIYCFRPQHNLNLIDLTNEQALIWLNSILPDGELKNRTNFMVGFGMSSYEQYMLYRRFAKNYGMKLKDYPLRVSVADLPRDDFSLLKRCSIYDVDVEIMKQLCQDLEVYDIHGITIGAIPTHYGTTFYPTWHDEAMFCCPKDDLIVVGGGDDICRQQAQATAAQ
jgi:hypothetical protein